MSYLRSALGLAALVSVLGVGQPSHAQNKSLFLKQEKSDAQSNSERQAGPDADARIQNESREANTSCSKKQFETFYKIKQLFLAPSAYMREQDVYDEDSKKFLDALKESERVQARIDALLKQPNFQDAYNDLYVRCGDEYDAYIAKKK